EFRRVLFRSPLLDFVPFLLASPARRGQSASRAFAWAWEDDPPPARSCRHSGKLPFCTLMCNYRPTVGRSGIMAGTDRSRTLLTGGPAIVLVEPQLGENIGMVARAMANFGLSELRIVRPRDGWPNDKARAAGSRADHVIAAELVFDDLGAAIANLHFVLATTARKRDDFRPVRAPVEAAADLRRRTGRGEKSGILFGRE